MELIRAGYDLLELYTESELRELYISQGIPTKEASKLSRRLYKELGSSIESERKFWRKVRKREQTGQSQEDIEDAQRL